MASPCIWQQAIKLNHAVHCPELYSWLCAPLPAWPSRPAGSPAVVPDTGTICMGPAVVEVLVAVLFSGGMSGSFP